MLVYDGYKNHLADYLKQNEPEKYNQRLTELIERDK